MLWDALHDTLPDDPEEAAVARQSLSVLMDVLRERKRAYQRRGLRIVSLISTADLERILMHGALGRHDLDRAIALDRRHRARQEVAHVAALLRNPPPGVQIGVVREPTPATTFQIFRQPDRSVLAISPFRLGEQPNVHLGVALITSAEEPMRLHENIARNLWRKALKAEEGAAHVDQLIARYGVQAD
jgi:hypothetical protein